MKLLDKVTLAILAILMLIFFYAGQATNLKDITPWIFLKEFSSVLGSFSAVGMIFIAYKALDSWREQIRGQLFLDSVMELEGKLQRYVLACLADPEDRKRRKDLLLFSDITDLCFNLRRREFNDKLVKSIEVALSETVGFLKKQPTAKVSKELTDNLWNELTNLTDFYNSK